MDVEDQDFGRLVEQAEEGLSRTQYAVAADWDSARMVIEELWRRYPAEVIFLTACRFGDGRKEFTLHCEDTFCRSPSANN